jgi:hypothetical protein
MPLSRCLPALPPFAFAGGCSLRFHAAVFARPIITLTNGTEYAVVGSLPGDQVFPDAAVTTGGGFVVWQDNATDGSGWGVSARRLDSTLVRRGGRVPRQRAGHERPGKPPRGVVEKPAARFLSGRAAQTGITRTFMRAFYPRPTPF